MIPGSYGWWVIDGHVTGLRVKAATRFIDRLVGVGPRVRFQSFDVLWIPSCQAVHTVGLRRSIDIVFATRLGRVVEVATAVEPSSWLWRPSAQAVWELRSGVALGLGVRIGGVVSVQHDPRCDEE